MRQGYTLLLGLLLLGCSVAWGAAGAAPKDFRGIPWGGTVPDALVKNDAAGSGGKVEVYRNRAKELPPFFGAPVTDEAYYFARGRLTGGLLFCRGEENYNRLKDSLVRIYGPPKNPKPDTYVWEWPVTQTLLTIVYNRKVQYGTISMTSGAGSPPGTTEKKPPR